jgi:hypothetical protein
MRAIDVMTPNVTTVDPDTTVQGLANLLSEPSMPPTSAGGTRIHHPVSQVAPDDGQRIGRLFDKLSEHDASLSDPPETDNGTDLVLRSRCRAAGCDVGMWHQFASGRASDVTRNPTYLRIRVRA